MRLTRPRRRCADDECKALLPVGYVGNYCRLCGERRKATGRLRGGMATAHRFGRGPAPPVPSMPKPNPPTPFVEPIRREAEFDVVWAGGEGLTRVATRPLQPNAGVGALRRGGRSVLGGGS